MPPANVESTRVYRILRACPGEGRRSQEHTGRNRSTGESGRANRRPGQQDTQQNRRPQGKVNGKVLAPVGNVARKPAQRESGSPQQQQQAAGDEQHQSQTDEQPAQVVHASILDSWTGSAVDQPGQLRQQDLQPFDLRFVGRRRLAKEHLRLPRQIGAPGQAEGAQHARQLMGGIHRAQLGRLRPDGCRSTALLHSAAARRAPRRCAGSAPKGRRSCFASFALDSALPERWRRCAVLSGGHAVSCCGQGISRLLSSLMPRKSAAPGSKDQRA